MTPHQHRRFIRLCAGLQDLIIEIREQHPEANLYMEGENGLYVLSGPSHTDGGDGASRREEATLANCQIKHASCGAW